MLTRKARRFGVGQGCWSNYVIATRTPNASTPSAGQVMTVTQYKLFMEIPPWFPYNQEGENNKIYPSNESPDDASNDLSASDLTRQSVSIPTRTLKVNFDLISSILKQESCFDTPKSCSPYRNKLQLADELTAEDEI